MAKHNSQNPIITGTFRFYRETNPKTGAVKGRFNIKDKFARVINYDNGEEVMFSWNPETRETCIKPLVYKT